MVTKLLLLGSSNFHVISVACELCFDYEFSSHSHDVRYSSSSIEFNFKVYLFECLRKKVSTKLIALNCLLKVNNWISMI